MESPKRNSKRHLTAHYSSISFFDRAAAPCLKGLEFAHCNPFSVEKSEDESLTLGEEAKERIANPVLSDSMYCHCCQTDFADRDDQAHHYKCDWHRYNLHLRLRNLPGISEEEFEKISGDVSSISGSDEESDTEKNDNFRINLQGYPQLDSASNDIEIGLSERKFHKVFFKNENGELISLYRCLLHHKKKSITSTSEICNAAIQAVRKHKWIVLMVSGGHFAGAVFNGDEIVEHKTFHRYTVRAKRGTAQSSRDGQGHAPKSAGASLRRYNEVALVQDVQELMLNWLNHLNGCELIFVHIPMANRSMFYGGKNPFMRKDDERIRIIPFPTRRPTFSEVKRVHQMLACVECYGQEADVRDFIPLSPQRMFNKDSGKLELCQMKPKPSKSPIRDLCQVEGQKSGEDEKSDKITDVDPAQDASTESESAGEDMDLVEEMVTLNLAADLKEFDSSVNKKRRKKKEKKTQEKCESSYDNHLVDEEERLIRNSIFTACKLGNVDNLHKALEELTHLPVCVGKSPGPQMEQISQTLNSPGNIQIAPQGNASSDSHTEILPQDGEGQTSENSEYVSPEQGSRVDQSLSPGNDSPTAVNVFSRILNTPIDEGGNTFLHLASVEGHSAIICVLMENGADPSIKNQAGKLAYNQGNTDARNSFRRFMAQFPDRYEYVKAQIPSPLTADMEEQKRQKLAKKRAEKKKSSNERNKAKKTVEKKIKEEEEEKKRYVSLSDREKRALAAEKRILQQRVEEGSSRPILSRCWQCGIDITGKIPFEYAEFKFCTTTCLRQHRAKAKS